MTVKRNFKTKIFLIITLILCAAIQVVVLNIDSTEGEKLTNIQKNLEKIETENRKLVQEIASASAIASISLKASQSGFTSNKNIVAVSSSLPLALSQRSSL